MKAKTVVYIAAVLMTMGQHVLGKGLKPRGVYLTVSSYGGLFHKPDQFEINWYGVEDAHQNRTFAAILRHSPNSTDWNIAPKYPITESVGRVKTSVGFPGFQVERLMTGECLGYWAVLVNVNDDGEKAAIVDSSCLRGRPRWMRESCCHIAGLKLDELFIPGTHDSAMYRVRSGWPIGGFIFTQEQTILQQLAFGIRSLDLRVGFIDGVFWVVHDRFKAQVTVEAVLKQVRDFVMTTGEIVILDIHRFTLGFHEGVDPVEERHRMLVNLILKTLGGLVAPRALLNVTVESILSSCGLLQTYETNSTVFVMYNYKYQGPHSEFLCPGLVQNWADAQDVNTLLKYLKKAACRKTPGTLSSAQAELTDKFPKQIDVLRELAELVNFNATNAFRELYWNCTNVVTSDYFLGTGMIELAIEANQVRGAIKDRSEERGKCGL
ncbi:PI-PLC X domain-containing protein 1-like [Haemaphysalis longicornis]